MALWKNVTKGLEANNALMIRQTEGVQVYEKANTLNQYNIPSVLHNALYEYRNTGQPVIMDYNLQSYIQNAYCKNSDWYAIVNYIMKASTRYRWKAKRRTRGGKLEDADESEVAGVLQQYVNSEFIQKAIGYLLNTGNTYVYGLSPENGANRGKIQELDVLPSHHTEILFGSIGDPVGGYKLTFGSQTKSIPAEAVCHLKYWNPDIMQGSDMYGMSPLRAMAMLMTKSNSTYKSEAMSMEHQGPPILLSRDKGEEFNREQALELSNDLARRFWGMLKRYTRIPVTGGSVKAVQLGLSPADLKILESHKMTFEQMCRPLGFPVTIADSKSATLDNMKVAERLLYAQCAGPNIYYLRDKMQPWLVPAYDKDIVLYIDDSEIEALQDDKTETATWLDMCPFIKVNRKQEIMGEEPDPNMDGYLIPAGYTFVKDPSELVDPPVDEETMKELSKIYG